MNPADDVAPEATVLVLVLLAAFFVGCLVMAWLKERQRRRRRHSHRSDRALRALATFVEE